MKLPYEAKAESSPVELASIALLLSNWCPKFSAGPRDRQRTWLGAGISHVKGAEVVLQNELLDLYYSTRSSQWMCQSLLRRLWWCCITSDRIQSLSFRTSLQIPRSLFDPDKYLRLLCSGPSNQATSSRVFSTETKEFQILIFLQIAKLCLVLTDI